MPRWKCGAKQNANPVRSRHFCAHSGPDSIGTPSSRSTSALPDLLDTARSPCFTTGTPAPHATSAAAVLMLNVPLSSPPVPQVSSTGPLTGTRRSICSRRTRAAAATSSAVSPFMRSAVRNAAARASSTRPATRSRTASVTPAGRKVAPGEEFGEQFGEPGWGR